MLLLLTTFSLSLLSSTSTASAPASPAPAAAVDVCERRADILAVRAAEGDVLMELRKRFDAEVSTTTEPRAKACAAAVAAEAAVVVGDKAASLVHLDTMLAGLPTLIDDVRPHRALLLAELGRADEARQELKQLGPKETAWRDRLTALVAPEAERTAALRRRSSRDPEALADLCTLGEQSSCTALLLRSPASPAARAIEKAPRAWPMAQATTRVQSLVAAARPHRAIEEGQLSLAAHKGAASATDELREVMANAMWRAGRTAEALPLTEDFVRNGAVVVPLARARAKTFARLGRGVESSDVWRAIRDDEYVTAEQRSEGAFFAGFALVEVDDVDGALMAFADGEDAMGPTWTVQAQWYRALLLLTAKQNAAAALPLLTQLSSTNDGEVRKYRFWRARALAAVGQSKEATVVRRALVEQDALDWYGLLARNDLRLPAILGTVVPVDAVEALAPDDDDARTTRLLHALGFDAEARRRCRLRAQNAKRPGLDQIGLCQRVDDATFGWRSGGLYPVRPEVKGGQLTAAPQWRVSYARPWAGAVDAATHDADISSSLLMGIMRTESGFDPSAVSLANARGPLQLLPSVARTVAAWKPALTSSSLAGERLGEPELAVALGARLLGRLVQEHGSMLMAAAAYNAGPEPAITWAKRFGALPVEVFVERIAFKETRNYVKKVLATEALYRGLEGGSVSLRLPTQIVAATTYTAFPYDE
jgi:soluble lytic murein transglycosylase-like protein